MSSCSISGVPRMTQTMKRLRSDMGRKPRKIFDQRALLLTIALALSSVSCFPSNTSSPPSSSIRATRWLSASFLRPMAPSGAQRFMEPKQMIRPSGREPISVTTNSFSVSMKPSLRADITVWNSDIKRSISPVAPKAESAFAPSASANFRLFYSMRPKNASAQAAVCSIRAALTP